MKLSIRLPYIKEYLLILLVWVPLFGAGQAVSIVSETSLQPLEDIAVFNNERKFSALSDERGQVEIKGLNERDSIHFQHPAYRPLSLSMAQVRTEEFVIYLHDRIIILSGEVSAASRQGERQQDVLAEIAVISSQEIAYEDPQTTPEVLALSGHVYLQKSQMGGGSPVLRGFEANKVLLVLDGVRLNNMIYRSGHLQNAITIDPHLLDRAEVVFGPGSVAYGSDALGGVMHFYTRKPQLTTQDTMRVQSRISGRYSSANAERTVHADVNAGGQKFASLTSFTFSSFGDLRIGHIGDARYPDFGKRFFHVKRFGNIDSMLVNDDEYKLRSTGYDQLDMMQKFRYRPSDGGDLILNVNYSTSSDIPRYDRLNDTLGGMLKYAEWSYGPQQRFMTALSLDRKFKVGFVDHYSFVVAYQYIGEQRISRRFRSPDRIDKKEALRILSVNLDLGKQLGEKHHLQYGYELITQELSSTATSKDINTGNIVPEATRYPDGGSTMQTAALYIIHKWQLSKRFLLTEGLRFNYQDLNAQFEDTSFYPLPFSEITAKNQNLSGSIGLRYAPGKQFEFRLLGTTGFRAPNVDDLAKVFDSSPGNVIVPNAGLKPEQAYNAELGISKSFQEDFKVSLSYFYTYLTDVIVRREFTFNGQDSILYEGILSKVQANINAGTAYVKGLSVDILADITEHLAFKTSINYTQGKDLSINKPLGHIPPIYGRSSFIFHSKKLRASIYSIYNGWKKLADYSPFNVDKLDEATVDGSPAWYTLNVRLAYQMNPHLRYQIALENIMDTHYKPFASGISAPGRNLVLAFKGNF